MRHACYKVSEKRVLGGSKNLPKVRTGFMDDPYYAVLTLNLRHCKAKAKENNLVRPQIDFFSVYQTII